MKIKELIEALSRVDNSNYVNVSFGGTIILAASTIISDCTSGFDEKTTVSEFIDILQKMPQGTDIFISKISDTMRVNGIEYGDNNYVTLV
jgi:hypothetical protein